MKNNPLEILFERATEDVSTFLWAVRAWPDDEGRHDPSYILLQILSAKGRAGRAMERLGQISSGDLGEDIRNVRKLQKMHQTAEREFAELLGSGELERAVNQDQGLQERLRLVTGQLLSIRKIVQDGLMDGNEEWLRDDYKAAVVSFLGDLSEFAWWFEAAPERLIRAEGFERLQSLYVRLEMALRKWFSCFHQAKEILARFRSREYDADFWWLRETPEPYSTAKDCLITDEMLPEIGRRLRRLKGTAEACPDKELLEDYALGREVPAKDKLEAHIAKCRWCQGTVAACQESEAIRKGEKPIPPKLAALLKKYSQKPASEKTSQEKLENSLDNAEVEILVPETGAIDSTVSRKKGKLLFLDDFRKKRDLKTEADLAASLQGLRFDPSTLPMAADSRRSPGRWQYVFPSSIKNFAAGIAGAGFFLPLSEKIFWGKRIELDSGIIKTITFFPVLVEKQVSGKTHFLFSGSVRLDPIMQDPRWFCDWKNAQGTTLQPVEFKILGSHFRAAFQQPFPSEGELRLLLIIGDELIF